eukprot:4388089-Prymnesium_polylepis.2
MPASACSAPPCTSSTRAMRGKGSSSSAAVDSAALVKTMRTASCARSRSGARAMSVSGTRASFSARST